MQLDCNDLTTACIRNLWRGKFSKVIAFFKVKNVSDLLQQGDLGVTYSWYCVSTCFATRFDMNVPAQMSILRDDHRNTSTSYGDGIVTMRWPCNCSLAAQVARNDLTTRCA
jgi:hypothetical protein